MSPKELFFLQRKLLIAGLVLTTAASIFTICTSLTDPRTITLIIVGGTCSILGGLIGFYQALVGLGIIGKVETGKRQESIQPDSKMDEVQDSPNLDKAVKM